MDVIVAEQMQDPVDQQARHLLFETVAEALGLTSRGVETDHHVPEHPRRDRLALPFELREGDDVGRMVLAPPLAVERVDRGVVREEDRQLSAR